MKRKIQDIALGKFDYRNPVLLIEEDELRLSVLEGAALSGCFHLKSSTGTPIRGIITSDHPGMEIETAAFDAASAQIRFTFHAGDSVEGQKEEGRFLITSSAGEYVLPFVVWVTREYPSSSIGRIKTLNDFTNLCQLNWEEALSIFASPLFVNLFHENAGEYRLLYHALTQMRRTSHEMEEFLIAAEKKKRNRFSVKEQQRTYHLQDRTLSDCIEVEKSEWGYLDVKISCDAPFIALGKRRLVMYDFRGKHVEFSYQLLPQQMHAGKNLAVIRLENAFQKLSIEITAWRGSGKPEFSRTRKKNVLFYQLECLFVDYLSSALPKEEWEEQSFALLDKIKQIDPDNWWTPLFRAYLFLTRGQRTEAKREMDSVPRSVRNGRTPIGGFYLYLVSLHEKNSEKRDVLDRVTEIAARYPGHPILNWIMLQIDESLLRNPARRYQAIRRYMEGGSENPIFYLEAAHIFREHPEILNSQDSFADRLISWMSRKNLLTRELLYRIQEIAAAKKSFSASFYRVLCRCWRMFGEERMVKTICVYLIKNNQFGETYFPWFARGVDQHLKIAGLYEAYMLSWSRSMGELPREIVKYFSMNRSLPAQKKATLFAYIVRNQERLGSEWPLYMEKVKEFAVAQLRRGQMSEDLAVIYEEIRTVMDPAEWESCRGDAENCYKIYSGQDVELPFVRVIHEGDPPEGRRVAMGSGTAYIYLHQPPAALLFEDAQGVRYAVRGGCRVSKMLSGNNVYAQSAAPAAESTPEEGAPASAGTISLEKMNGTIEELTALLLQRDPVRDDCLKDAEQLMIRMLFTGHFPREHRRVFDLIREDPESERLMTAYVTVLSREALFAGGAPDEEIRSWIASRMHKRRKLNVYCRTAWLAGFAGSGAETENQTKVPGEGQTHRSETCMHSPGQEEVPLEALSILEEHLIAGNYFGFYEKLPAAVKRKYLLIDLRVITCRDKAGQSLFLDFSGNTRESLKEVLPGLYTFPVRLLPGETLSWRICDREGSILDTGLLEAGPLGEEYQDTRFGRVSSLQAGRNDTKNQYSYAELCDVVQTLFQLIR